MIYQIEDEKKKIRHRSSDDFSGGLSEEELLKLIEEVETGEMIHAPVHLKNNVLTQIRKERDGNRKRQLFVYRAKVLIAMAAALMVLILMPAGRMEDVCAKTGECSVHGAGCTGTTQTYRRQMGSVQRRACKRWYTRDDR